MKPAIAVLASLDYKPNRSGVAQMAYHIALELHRAGWPVVVLAPQADADEYDRAQPFKTIRALPLRQQGLAGTMRFAKGLPALRQRLRSITETHGIRYILSAEGWSFMGYSGYLLGLVVGGLRVPQGIVLHGKDVLMVARMPWIKRALFRKAMDRVHDVFCNSRFTADHTRPAFGKPVNPVVVGCGICPQSLPRPVGRERARNQLGIHASEVLFTLARLVPRKGIDMVIRALPELVAQGRDVVYVVAGAGYDIDRLRGLANDLGCADRVRFDGPIDDSLLAHYYCAADVFVMPSRSIAREDAEGFGIVYVEAGHYGLAVIGGRSGGVSDAILDGQTGLLVNPEDPHEISQAVLRVLMDPPFARQLGAAGQQRAWRELTWDNVVRPIAAKIESALVSQPGSSNASRSGTPGSQQVR